MGFIYVVNQLSECSDSNAPERLTCHISHKHIAMCVLFERPGFTTYRYCKMLHWYGKLPTVTYSNFKWHGKAARYLLGPPTTDGSKVAFLSSIRLHKGNVYLAMATEY